MTAAGEAADLYDRGVSAHLNGRPAEALVLYERALALAPDHAPALNNRGAALHKLGRAEEALASCQRAASLSPEYLDAISNCASISLEMKRYDEALAHYDKWLAIKPGSADVEGNRAAVLLELGRIEEALAGFDRSLALKPADAAVLSNRGLALQGLRCHQEALESYDRALAVDPGHGPAWNNRGFLFQELKQFPEALASYDRAIEINPDDALAHTNKGICLLLLGDLENGWRESEWRWKSRRFTSARRDFVQPLWLGRENIAGRTILLHAEQGLGDTIQFVRYVAQVVAKGATVILEVPHVLSPLLSGLPGVAKTVSEGGPLPHFDFHCPLLSLPLAFATRLDTVPAGVPYLAVDEAAVSAWRAKLAGGGKRLVGLCWKGSPRYRGDRDRSIRLSELRSLFSAAGVRFVSLQKDLSEEEQKLADTLPDFVHVGAGFAHTAELIAALDLIISVDTVWAHWAGAIGRPLWLLLPFVPHWGWLLDREDSPWYPTARLFRQADRGDWTDVIARVTDALRRP